MPASIHAGDVLADRYEMVDLLSETKGGWFWCAHDEVLRRQVAVQLIAADDERADELMAAARRSAALIDRRNLRVLDADRSDRLCYVVNEWGSGESLDVMLADHGPLNPRRAAWLVAEVADTLAVAHAARRAHGRMFPENVMVDENGQVRIIGFAIDAALHGLPADRTDQDVRDLVGLLYAALTGKWPGAPTPRVPSAPVVHGHPLRPRQVRAGIPRALDLLCDEVLGARPGRGHGLSASLPGMAHRPHHDLGTAAGVRDALEEFLGDPATGTFPATPAAPADPADPADQMGEAGPAGRDHTEQIPTPTSTSADVPTEAGMPVFRDGEEVEWLRARGNRPAPPPDFEEPVARPLFAADPEDGAPARRPRAPRPAPSEGNEYWPWDTSTGHGAHTNGSGVLPPVPPERVPGRRWMRLALFIGLVAFLLLSVVAAYQLGGGGREDSGDDASGSSRASSSSPGAPTPFTDVVVADFDPEGTPPEENPDLAPLAADGDPATTWRTLTYTQQFGLTGLKMGVGLTIDLQETEDVRRVEISVVGADATTAEVFVTDEPLTSVASDAEPAGSGTDESTIVVELDEAVSGRYVTVWLTEIPAIESGFRGEVSEVVVSG